MSVVSLRTQITEDYLTCAICSNNFIKPKALPCIHTFCESCLRDYVASRGYESAPTFPCPICRGECTMPSQGVEGFPNNHLMCSLSDTVAKVDSSRPVPKPRRSLGNLNPTTTTPSPIPTSENRQIAEDSNEGTSVDTKPSYHNMHRSAIPFTSALGPDDFEVINNEGGARGTSVDNSPPPPYSSVANSKVCSNDTDPSWMIVPTQHPSMTHQSSHSHGDFNPVSYPQYPSQPQSIAPSSTQPIGWNSQNNFSSSVDTTQAEMRQNMQYPALDNSTNSALYPSVPQSNQFEMNTVCSNNLMLRFGKQGSTARDFIKPVGLAIDKDGQYIVSDSGGDQNRIMIFNSGGEITTAFKCGAEVKDIAVTKKNEIIASTVGKQSSTFRLFTITGQLKGEFGNFLPYEKLSGIAELNNQGIVVTGTEENCVYSLTPQMKFSTKFGRKGKGDGYFLNPGFVTVDSKNHIIVSDKKNGYIQVFNSQGKFKQRFGSDGHKSGQLQEPLGVCVDSKDNIVVADSGNFRVEAFSPTGRWLSSVVTGTNQLGENVKPVNVAVTPTGKVAVLLCGPYFAEVRVYSSKHQHIALPEGSFPPLITTTSCWRH